MEMMETIEYGNPDAPVVLIQMVDDHDLDGMDIEVREIRERTDADFRLAAIRVPDWNVDLSPWAAPAVFGRADFGSGAPDTLSEVLKYCADREKRYLIGGYSLAGLFALWAACRTDVFRGIAAASPSVWFPGFTDFLRENEVHADRVFLSLGDKEKRTRNHLMATVEERIIETHHLLEEQGIRSTLEWNPGNHFKDPEIRTAKAFSWVLGELRSELCPAQ